MPPEIEVRADATLRIITLNRVNVSVSGCSLGHAVAGGGMGSARVIEVPAP